MNINIKATNTTLTDSMKADVTDKVAVIEKFLKEEDTVYVEFDVDTRHKSGDIQRAEIRISPRGYYAESYGSDVYEALDLAIPKIREQLTKEKDKKISLRRKLGAFFKRNK